MLRRILVLLGLLLMFHAAAFAATGRPVVIEYGAKDDGIGRVLLPGLDARNTPGSVAVTDDGAIWFLENFSWHPRIARIDRNHHLHEFRIPDSEQGVYTFAPFSYGLHPLVADGNGVLLGASDDTAAHVRTLSAEGKLGEKDISNCIVAGPTITCVANTIPVKIRMGGFRNSATIGRDGNIWFTDIWHSRIGRIGPSGKTRLFTQGLTPSDSGPQFITAGPDGNLWFTEVRDRIGRVTPDGRITEFWQGIPKRASLGGIVAGCDGNLWFTLYHGMVLGRITPSGVVTQFHDLVYPSDGHDFDPLGMIAKDGQGRLYYNESQAGRIARATIPCKFRR
ncbi:MAG: hypothetical protein ABR584_07900 [Candidatus Baltobacteraceae bacterium]